MIRALHHAQITIPKGQEAQARDFYCGLLGLEEIEKPDVLRSRGGLWLRVGELQIHVGTEDGIDRLKTKAHLGFEVDDLRELRRRIEGLGLEVTEGEPLPGLDRFEFRDPFGNRMELLRRSGA